MTHADVDWMRLAATLQGRLIRADEPDHVLAGKQFAAGEPLPYPDALIRCAGLADVHRTLDFLRAHDVPFAIRSGGHCFGDLSSSSAAVVDLGAMDACVPLDDAAGRIRVGPGLLGGDAVRALASLGRTVPTGGCPHVALGGLSLVGGFGFLGRLHGLTADRVRRIELVTAENQRIDISASEHADLFWALRGAGAGGFGIVTALELETVPLTPALAVCGAWPLAAATDLFAYWQARATDAPDHVNLQISLSAPDDPALPCTVQLYGIVLPAPGAQSPCLDALSGLGAITRRLRVMPLEPAAAGDYFTGLLDRRARPAWQPSRPYRAAGYQFTRSQFFESAIDPDAFASCVAHFESGRAYGECREIEIIPWRGAYARPPGDSAFLHREASMLIRHTAMLGARATPPLRAGARAWCDRSRDSLAAYANGHAYQGYADRRLPDWSTQYYGSHYSRLQAIKHRYDPDQVFRHAQSIAPLAADFPPDGVRGRAPVAAPAGLA
jgi:FAD/FMN-containing dehydrogenase